MNKTKIEWCDTTWNPVTGCYHTCPYCYARKIATRFAGCGNIYDGNFVKNKKVGDKLIHELYMPTYRYTKLGKFQKAIYSYGFEPTFHRYRLNEPQRKTKPQTIFVCSMADLFGAWVPDEWIEQVFEACEKAPKHRYLFLTKNPDRYQKLYLSGKLPLKHNMWYGVSVTNDIEAEKIRDSLGVLDIGYRTFISVEPLLTDIANSLAWERTLSHCTFSNWIIIGAETGNRKNKIIPDKKWIDKILSSCKRNSFDNISIFMKDSLLPIVGEENMLREFPWDR